MLYNWLECDINGDIVILKIGVLEYIRRKITENVYGMAPCVDS